MTPSLGHGSPPCLTSRALRRVTARYVAGPGCAAAGLARGRTVPLATPPGLRSALPGKDGELVMLGVAGSRGQWEAISAAPLSRLVLAPGVRIATQGVGAGQVPVMVASLTR